MRDISRFRGWLLAATVLLNSWSAAGAPAQATDPLFIGWSQLLPAWAYQFTPGSANACAAGRPACVERTLTTMKHRFWPLAGSCDHNAVFALAYLRTTQEYRRTAADPAAFDDVAFVNHEDAVFAQFYFDSYDSWATGHRAAVPTAWRIAFDAARNQRVTGTGNLLLGMSAHVNRDLPFVLAGIGLVAPDGTSRKPDHDRINAMLNRVVGPLLAEEAQRFDPTVDDVDTPYGISYTALMQLLVGWRETAWRNAERLVAAEGTRARNRVEASIEAYATGIARTLVQTYQYAPPLYTAASRNAYCARP